MVVGLILLTWFSVFLYCSKNPVNILYVAIIDSMLPIRFYESLGGIPFSAIFLFSIVISLIANNGRIVAKFNKHISLLLVTIIYFAFTNFKYFGTIDLTIFNNFFLIFIVQSSIVQEDLEEIWYKICKLFVLVGLILSLDSFITFVSLFGNPRQVGFYLLISIIFCIAGIRSGYRSFFFNNKTLIFLFFAMVLTQGRLNFGIGVLLILLNYSFGKRININQIIGFAFLCIVLVMFLNSPIGEEFFLRKSSDVSNVELDFEDKGLASLSSGRSVIYEDAWTMFMDHPIFGYGYKSFSDINNPYNTIHAFGSSQKISLHSVFLQYLSETGILGFLLYYIFLISLIKFSFKLRKRISTILQHDYLYISICWVFLTVPLIMILGSFLDNHGVHYKHIFIITALIPFLKADLKRVELKSFSTI
ncbi:O-antigen ligase [Christiangramia gaetbulicola]|uniref:O-antigen ligase n=1 Tax=Christiangramia gaetbulicola TaxID=703340 RepID=A0A2T6AKY8_9FLAO|nr:O-antigen ligase family protein [Christiangramia gaetbulicola]PTX44484.1 O-antigen ligase [Christiangramia gaetbulicola]